MVRARMVIEIPAAVEARLLVAGTFGSYNTMPDKSEAKVRTRSARLPGEGGFWVRIRA